MPSIKDNRQLVPELTSSRVLVVDDDDDIRRILVIVLGDAGHTVIEAENGIAAIDRCKEQLPDLIVSDIMMPGLDGPGFVRWVRETYPNLFIPILMLTARTEVEQKVRTLEGGADEYLTKPFNHREFEARVNALLRIKVLNESLSAKNEELQKLNEELIKVQNDLLEKERRLLAIQFAGTAAHAMGQPITAILLNCHVLEQSCVDSRSPEKLNRFPGAIKAIRKECETMSTILEKLRKIDLAPAEDYPGDMKICDLSDMDEKPIIK